jgi:hypothetical protein
MPFFILITFVYMAILYDYNTLLLQKIIPVGYSYGIFLSKLFLIIYYNSVTVEIMIWIGAKDRRLYHNGQFISRI